MNRTQARSLRFVLTFAVCFVVLQQVYIATRAWTDNLINHQLNAVVCAQIINVVTPQEQVSAQHAKLKGRQSELDIKKGCEGFEVVLILVSAMAAYPGMTWRRRLSGIVLGTVYIYVLNLVRVVSLYYLATYKPDLFDQAHLTVWQSLLILAACGFLFFWIPRRKTLPRNPPRAAPVDTPKG